MWKDEFNEKFTSMAYGEKWRPGIEFTPTVVKAFIQSKFAELIDEIPDAVLLKAELGGFIEIMDTKPIKQILKNHWL